MNICCEYMGSIIRRFVPNYALTMKPTMDLLKKDVEFKWGACQQHAFETVKRVLCSAPALVMYDVNAHHEVHTDASSMVLAAILLQAPTNDPSQLKSVQYFSRRTKHYVQKYHSYELELLAVVAALERFKLYLMGKSFRVMTDCQALVANETSKQRNARVARWWLKLQEFDFSVSHRAGERMAHVDALSRNPVEPSAEMDVAQLHVHHLEFGQEDWLATMQRRDDKLLSIVRALQDEQKTTDHQQMHADYAIRNHRLFRKTVDGLKLVVPGAIIWRVVQNTHDELGHFGVGKTLDRLKSSFWFPRMRQLIKKYILECIECCYRQARPTEGEMHFPEVVAIPFHTVHADHLGPFKTSLKSNAYLIVLCDAFTKFVMLKAVGYTKTKPVIQFLNELSAFFGTAIRLITDRGTSYTSHQFKYCRANDIRHVLNAVRTHRANGQVERLNQTVLAALRTLVQR